MGIPFFAWRACLRAPGRLMAGPIHILLPWGFDRWVAPLPIQLFLQGHLVLLLPQTVDPAFFNCEGELVVPCLQLAEDVQFFRQASVHPGEPIEHFRRWSPRTPVHHRHRLFV